MAGQQHDETVAQQDVTSHEAVVAETVTRSRDMRDTAYVALRATTSKLPSAKQVSMDFVRAFFECTSPADILGTVGKYIYILFTRG